MYKRLSFVYFTFALFFGVILVRLFFWQVVSFDLFKGLAEKQTLASLKIPAKRGNIYASDKAPLVINQKAYLVYAEPHNLEDIKKAASYLSKTLEIPISSVSAKLNQDSLRWVPVADKVEEEKVRQIKEKKLKGIGFLEKTKRYYPEASMAAHILGFVGKNFKGDDQGYFGIEGYYDEQLKGRDGMRKQEEDAFGNPIIVGRNEEIDAEDGRDLYLTVDKTVQFIVESELLKGIEKYEAKGGTVIVIDPKSGAIISMASFPSYDPAIFDQFPQKYYKNPAVSSSYEPGSTFKVLVLASALNEKKITPETEYDEVGPIEIGGYTIKTWNQEYHGKISISDILKYSSNVGMVFIQKELGAQELIRYVKNLGFGSLTDVDLQEESSPEIKAKKNMYEIDYATLSFGQGIAVTPLQMVRAVSAIANEGKMVKPYVVSSIHLENGKKIDIQKKEKKVFEKEVASIVTEMMVSAVEEGETKKIKPEGYTIAGKTGTAQIAIAGHYDEEKTIASFVGFAPAYDPKFLMLVTINEPTSSPWGSETAAPVFFNIAKELFSYYGISPSR